MFLSFYFQFNFERYDFSLFCTNQRRPHWGGATEEISAFSDLFKRKTMAFICGDDNSTGDDVGGDYGGEYGDDGGGDVGGGDHDHGDGDGDGDHDNDGDDSDSDSDDSDRGSDYEQSVSFNHKVAPWDAFCILCNFAKIICHKSVKIK